MNSCSLSAVLEQYVGKQESKNWCFSAFIGKMPQCMTNLKLCLTSDPLLAL